MGGGKRKDEQAAPRRRRWEAKKKPTASNRPFFLAIGAAVVVGAVLLLLFGSGKGDDGATGGAPADGTPSLLGSKEPPAAGDGSYVVSVSSLPDWARVSEDAASHERFHRIRHRDGSVELDYEYDGSLRDGILMSCTITRCTSPEEAVAAVASDFAGYRIGFAGSDVVINRDDEAVRGGDGSRYAVLVDGEGPLGHLFACHRGNSAFSFMCSGIIFEDADLAALLEPYLARFHEWAP